VALAKYYEDILDRLTEDLAEGVTGSDIHQELTKMGWPPSKPSKVRQAKVPLKPTESLGELDGKIALRHFLVAVTSQLKRQKETNEQLRAKAISCDAEIKRLKALRDTKDRALKDLQTKLKQIASARARHR